MNWYSVFWRYWAWVAFEPMLLCGIYRFFTQEDCSKYKSSPPKSYKLDHIFRLLLSPGLFYYTLDSIYILWQYDRMSPCNFSYVFHHVVTLAGARSCLTLPYFPWHLILPFACHNLLIMFPYASWLNYIYLVLILNNFYKNNCEPWYNWAQYRFINYVGYTLLAGPIFMLWYFGCKNDMTNVL